MVWTMILFFLTIAAWAQEGKKALSLEDYPGWSRIVGADISDDGQWASFAYRPNEGEDTLHIKQMRGNGMHTIPLAASATFSPDNQWAAYMISLPKDERERLQRDRKPVPRKAQVIHLASGNKWTYENAASVSFSPDGRFLAVRKAKADPAIKHGGTDLIIRHLKDRVDQNFGNVSEFSFNERSSHLAYVVDADQRSGNGVYITDLANFSIKPLDTDTMTYSNLTWDDSGLERPAALQKGTTLAVLKGHQPKGKVQLENQLLVFRQVNTPTPRKILHQAQGLSDDLVLSERGSLQWSQSGKVLFVNVIEQRPEPPKPKDKLSNVEVWHWEDELIQSVQKVRNNALSNTTYRAAFHVDDNSLVVLGSDELRTVLAGRQDAFVMGADPRPHISDVNWGVSPADYYRVNVRTGQRELVEENVGRSMGLSPDASKWIYLKNGEVYLYDIVAGKKVHLTANTELSFVNVEDDHPYELPAYGVGGWTKDGKSVILNHKYDLYKVALDGSRIENIAGGMGDREEIRFRVVNLNPDERYIDLSKPLTLSAYGEWTKKSGFYQLRPGRQPESMAYTDHLYGSPRKARNADVLMYTRETFVDFPDYYVSAIDFKNPLKITDANPQQADYAWGRRVLVDYTNGKGERMQGTLALPAGYEEGKTYPMVVYFYELMSQRHHQYSMPVYDDRPHMSTYASNGYLVFMPDVRYDEGTPGSNALDNVTSSVQKVIDLGYADPARIGLQGHSWGGYQSSFIVTQTDMFACVVTGAPVTNLVSMYNILYKQTGTVNHGIFEIGQVRMGRDVTPWSHRDLYVSQSPIEHVDKITTPFMILHGTADGAVDYNQGLELYNAARRMGKEVILLTYPDEPHHLGMLENQKDFQKRMMQYFDHYLKGTEAPEWLKKGMPFRERSYALPLKD